MKIRYDFVTNSSSSSFTVIKINSSIIDKYIKSHPIRYGGSMYKNMNKLIDAIIFEKDADGLGIEVGTNLFDSMIDIIGDVDNQEERFYDDEEEMLYDDETKRLDDSIIDLMVFLNKNRKEIEKEGEGEIICYYEDDGLTSKIRAVFHQNGKSQYKTFDFYEDLSEEQQYDDKDLDFINSVLSEYGKQRYGRPKEFCDHLHDFIMKYGKCLNDSDGQNGDSELSDTQGNRIANKRFCVIGDLEGFSDKKHIKRFIEMYGGEFIGSISLKTDYIITNTPDCGAVKNKLFHDPDVKVISEEEFIAMVDGD